MTMVDIDGPAPPAGREFCTYCLMVYKAAIVYQHQAEIDALQKDGEDKVVHWDLRNHEEGIEGLMRPRLAIGIGPVNNNAQWGFAKVCWLHLAYVPGLLGITEVPGAGLSVARGDVEHAVKELQQGPAGSLIPGLKGQRG